VPVTIKSHFHKASNYFEEKRAVQYLSDPKLESLYKISRSELAIRVLFASGVNDCDLEDSDGVDLFAAFLHAGYRSLLNNLGWILMFCYAHKRGFEALANDKQYNEVSGTKFVKEVLRLTPSGWNLHRVATRDFNLSGKSVSAGDNFQISPLCFHWNEKYYHHPLEFYPERFDSKIEPWTYFPFGGGEFKCPGTRLSLELSKTFLRVLRKSYTIKAERVGTYPTNYCPISLNPFKIFEFSVWHN
jgi:cytochrome P450